MKLGMNMLLWSTDVSGSEYDETFAMLKDAGFDGVEIPIFDREVDKYAALGAPRICGPLGAPLGVFSGAPPTAAERDRAVAYLQEVAPYAEERGVTIVLEYLNR